MRLFSSDLDNTLLGNAESAHRFAMAWTRLPPERRPLLVYNSGRLVPDMQRLVREGALLVPDYFIGGVGTQIAHGEKGVPLPEFDAHLNVGWDRGRVDEIVAAFPGTRLQPEEYQTKYKSSWFLDGAPKAALDEIHRRLTAAGLRVQVVYSSQRDLDIVPEHATKGSALAWLCQHLSVPLEEVVVAGDTGNDATMLRLPGVKAIVVENSQPELFEATVDVPTYHSRAVMADGVLDGLRHFGVIDELPPASATGLPRDRVDPVFRQLFKGEHLRSLTSDEKQLLLTGYDRALVALRKNITPLGFSACSLTDNSVTGTDANYRSVWARDGAITIINTLGLDDEDIRHTQRTTLHTLLTAQSPNGQIPANVRLDDGLPDYAGVGNICSIDSGLWVIIAFYNFVAHTRDLDFLRTHQHRLQRAMDWLSAHDSNNDGLLEIPEAGDWTDLFGRSYNVLYDEVLWFRANVSFGRLCEFLGDYEKAAGYLRWSQHIRARVLEVFWPTTKKATPGAASPHHFAARQFSLGDTQYLIAEVTPFAFNWRCDVFANILAYLVNLLDLDRAKLAFRFMWGVGVHDPWPVANLYPVVQAGDPDWRAYYTVNLLNLPHHYHNGGIWPFVGGMWVRFIHRLGLHDVACRELVKLARVNQLGRDFEWEFNEWAHGDTGRPMGKAYQAWSAACFIHACQELETDPAHLRQD